MLAFVGVKMLVVDLFKVPIAVSLAVIAAILGLSVALSLLAPRRADGTGEPALHGTAR